MNSFKHIYVYSLQEMLELVKNYHKVRYFERCKNSVSILSKRPKP